MANPKPGEDLVVRRIAGALAAGWPTVPAGEVWIGDDAAVVAAPRGPLVLATDAVVDGVHTDLAFGDLADLGWKALAVTVSDIGAMGARPLHALVTLCLPPATDVDLLVAGIAQAALAFGCPVVGGDVTGSDRLMVSVAATGVLDGLGGPVLRSGAQAGDALVLTGPLGGSAAGLRALRSGATGPPAAPYRRPVPRLAEGVTARSAGASAMMDVSDGLAIDLHRLADASGVGFSLVEVPVAAGATEDEALSGGEDYELVVATADPERLEAAFAAAGLRPPLVIGACTGDHERRELRGAPLARLGWQHALGDS